MENMKKISEEKRGVIRKEKERKRRIRRKARKEIEPTSGL